MKQLCHLIAAILGVTSPLTMCCESLSEASDLMLRSDGDRHISRQLDVGVGESYGIEIKDGKWGTARILRSRVAQQSEWDDVEYLLEVTTDWDNAALKELLEAVNAKITEEGLTPVEGRNAKAKDEDGDSKSDQAGELIWGRAGDIYWHQLPLDSRMFHEMRVLFERYIGGIAFLDGYRTRRDERVFVFEGSGLEGQRVDLEEFKKDLASWSGRRVVVEGALCYFEDPDLRYLVKGPLKFVGVEDPAGKLNTIANGVRVRIEGNFVMRGERDKSGNITRITSVEVLVDREEGRLLHDCPDGE